MIKFYKGIGGMQRLILSLVLSSGTFVWLQVGILQLVRDADQQPPPILYFLDTDRSGQVRATLPGSNDFLDHMTLPPTTRIHLTNTDPRLEPFVFGDMLVPSTVDPTRSQLQSIWVDLASRSYQPVMLPPGYTVQYALGRQHVYLCTVDATLSDQPQTVSIWQAGLAEREWGWLYTMRRGEGGCFGQPFLGIDGDTYLPLTLIEVDVVGNFNYRPSILNTRTQDVIDAPSESMLWLTLPADTDAHERWHMYNAEGDIRAVSGGMVFRYDLSLIRDYYTIHWPMQDVVVLRRKTDGTLPTVETSPSMRTVIVPSDTDRMWMIDGQLWAILSNDQDEQQIVTITDEGDIAQVWFKTTRLRYGIVQPFPEQGVLFVQDNANQRTVAIDTQTGGITPMGSCRLDHCTPQYIGAGWWLIGEKFAGNRVSRYELRHYPSGDGHDLQNVEYITAQSLNTHLHVWQLVLVSVLSGIVVLLLRR